VSQCDDDGDRSERLDDLEGTEEALAAIGEERLVGRAVVDEAEHLVAPDGFDDIEDLAAMATGSHDHQRLRHRRRP
jgi:hypothetical protein